MEWWKVKLHLFPLFLTSFQVSNWQLFWFSSDFIHIAANGSWYMQSSLKYHLKGNGQGSLYHTGQASFKVITTHLGTPPDLAAYQRYYSFENLRIWGFVVAEKGRMKKKKHWGKVCCVFGGLHVWLWAYISTLLLPRLLRTFCVLLRESFSGELLAVSNKCHRHLFMTTHLPLATTGL